MTSNIKDYSQSVWDVKRDLEFVLSRNYSAEIFCFKILCFDLPENELQEIFKSFINNVIIER